MHGRASFLSARPNGSQSVRLFTVFVVVVLRSCVRRQLVLVLVLDVLLDVLGVVDGEELQRLLDLLQVPERAGQLAGRLLRRGSRKVGILQDVKLKNNNNEVLHLPRLMQTNPRMKEILTFHFPWFGLGEHFRLVCLEYVAIRAVRLLFPLPFLAPKSAPARWPGL